MKDFLEICGAEIRFPSLPVWHGPQESPGMGPLLPLSLGQDSMGYFRQTTPIETRREIVEAYGNESYVHFTLPPGLSDWANRLGRTQIKFILENGDFCAGAGVLEIGGGSGLVSAEIAHEFETAKPVVIDPALRKCSDQEIEIITDYFPSRQLSQRTFDRVLSFNCLEHVDDPYSFLTEIHRSLRQGGRAILSFPDTERQFESGDLNVVSHEHLSYFDRESALNLLRSAGLEPVAFDSHEDSLWIAAEKTDLPAQKLHKIRETGSLVKAGNAFRDSVARGQELVISHLERGKLVGFHGATNGLNSFLHSTNIHSDRIICFDGDISKKGKYLPAALQPIRHCSDESYKQVSVIFVSAMTYFGEIVADGRTKYGLSGDVFVPLFERLIQ